jgi:hypothetical protein
LTKTGRMWMYTHTHTHTQTAARARTLIGKENTAQNKTMRKEEQVKHEREYNIYMIQRNKRTEHERGSDRLQTQCCARNSNSASEDARVSEIKLRVAKLATRKARLISFYDLDTLSWGGRGQSSWYLQGKAGSTTAPAWRLR